jgi:hypothetical protein
LLLAEQLQLLGGAARFPGGEPGGDATRLEGNFLGVDWSLGGDLCAALIDRPCCLSLLDSGAVLSVALCSVVVEVIVLFFSGQGISSIVEVIPPIRGTVGGEVSSPRGRSCFVGRKVC